MRHPVHAAFVHFPLALLGTSVGFDAAALAGAGAVFWTIAFWNIALGLVLALATVVSGSVDSAAVPSESSASAVVTRHLVVMLAALGCYGAALAVRGGSAAPVGHAVPATLALEGVGLALLLFGGWLGGELVYRHGVGRAR
jgi:uncharacterized membrane protein